MEVNDFNAIRISLASPEQVRSWSYGEVMKPETINYRTLKPEKDGLFCEKIFGPTKDFECYCGKYKRVRYKGIVCDKCGVEVTRSKVRRERMGHIELASPVAHIWFVKGTPSRIGLLLDISPRSLERVLYFAQFIVTAVDEEVRKQALEAIQREMDEATGGGESEHAQRIAELEAETTAAIAQVETQREERLTAAEAAVDRDMAALKEKAAALAEEIAKVGEKKAPRKMALDDKFILATRGEKLPADAAKRLQAEAKRRQTALEAGRGQRRAAEERAIEASVEKLRTSAMSAMEPLRRKVNEERESVRAEYLARIGELEDLKDPIRDDQCTLLPEQTLRELNEKCPGLVKAGMGAEAVLDILDRLELDQMALKLRAEIQNFSGQRRKKATKRLRVVEALRKSGNKPAWMVAGILPVLPPDLRPMVQLDGGRFATSDLNDLYRRVINRNNRLKRLLELGAPEIIIRNEKRMLQEAVDSLIDNGRRGRAVSTAGNHKLKSLSDMLKGKQGRFRQNLLGKRVDYSGRSVIVVGPELKLHQCGLPKRMALELFKPFVMHGLVARGLAHNIKSAKRIVERARPEVWDILDEIVSQRPVLLNRAPTLHRLGIQAFEPVLIDGSAIQIHPLVCTAFNADFDGDQMAVHVPLSRASVAEARQIMLSTQNLLYPSSGEPVVAPTLDIVLGCYYMTDVQAGGKGGFDAGPPPRGIYSSFDEAKLAYACGHLDLRAAIRARDSKTNGELIETTAGRIIFNEVLPAELGFRNHLMDKKAIKELVAEACHRLDNATTAEMVDRMKNTGFIYATKSGISIAMNDLRVPEEKAQLLADADARIAEIEDQFNLGLITEEERYTQAVAIWRNTTDKVQQVIQQRLEEYGGVYIMAVSGAKGNISQISQMAGMRGLMSDPAGRIIDLPIRSSFREGLTVLEYFISTHGARKGLADTALRTADSGYLTRRLIDVAQDVIIVEEDCGTTAGIWVGEPSEKGLFESLSERIVGRMTAADVADPKTGEIIVERRHEINDVIAQRIIAAGIDKVYVRSPLTCQTKRGLCGMDYGRDLAHGQFVRDGAAVGIIGAQSIGEPGTQLTMRTFHTGGVAGLDITSGLPRVEELFEARVPKGSAIIAEIDGTAEVMREGDRRTLRITSAEVYRDDYALPKGTKMLIKDGQDVEQGAVIAHIREGKGGDGQTGQAMMPAGDVIARTSGQVSVTKGRISILFEEREQRDYPIPAAARLRVHDADYIHAGQPLTEGPLNPQDILRIQGPEAVQIYLVEEVQKVYRSQGVSINDKHIEVIVRQMLRRVRVDSPGDSRLLPSELVDRFKFEMENARVLAEGGEPATAQPVLLGVTKASLNTESFLAAASFQETTRVLTEAAINGAVDHLLGLKENVIIGKLIPARATIELETLPSKITEMVLPSGLREEGGKSLDVEGAAAWEPGADEDELEEELDVRGAMGLDTGDDEGLPEDHELAGEQEMEVMGEPETPAEAEKDPVAQLQERAEGE
ncbi:MAG: DNA-directed RNA polymerase subunit beta' [Dehalococcoidia bacterium]|nr:DNA-directed RNA polymerase subunit beta' [Dehalococcoidia bacterium]